MAAAAGVMLGRGIAATSPAPPMPLSAVPMQEVPSKRKAGNAVSDTNAPAETPASEPMPELKGKEKDEKASSKLDSKLVGLRGKLVNGSFSQGNVKVVNGLIKVNVYLAEMSDTAIQAVKDAGGKVVSERRSGKMLLVSVRVEDLEKLAALGVVTRIEPSGA
jgi:hypothetical protein